MLANQKVWDDIFVFMDKKYPDRWEFQDEHRIVVHYPEVLMKNTAGKEHLITDLFISLPVDITDDNQQVLTGGFYGMRMSASKAELHSGYLHSHLGGCSLQNYADFSSFCRGYGPITMHLTKCKAVSFTLTDFKLLMYNVDTYVAYESTNTNPYKRFEGLSGFVKASESVLCTESRIKESVSKIANPEKLRIIIKNNKAILLRPEKLNEVYGDNLRTFFPTSYLVSKSADGIYYQLNSSHTRTISQQQQEFIDSNTFSFKGKTIEFRITDNTVDREEVIHPFIISQLKKYIENEFNYKSWMEGFIHPERREA